MAAGAVGVIGSGDRGAEITANGRADIVVIGRAMLADAAWPLRAAKARGADVAWPVQYERGSLGHGNPQSHQKTINYEITIRKIPFLSNNTKQ